MDTLFNAGLEQVISQGIWCILFVIMLWKTMKTNEEREAKYEKILTEQTQTLLQITKSLECINTKIESIDEKVSVLEEHEKVL